MRTIELSNAFKRDYKRTKANPCHAQDVRALYETAVLLLAKDEPLSENYRDHALKSSHALSGASFFFTANKRPRCTAALPKRARTASSAASSRRRRLSSTGS